MNILYCGDKNIEDGLIISILSILKNINSQINFYVMTMKYGDKQPVSDNIIKLLEKEIKKVNKNSSINKINTDEYFFNDPPTANLQTRFTPYCMLRLYADKISELPDKILYLDNDVVCLKNFENFYNMDLTNIEYAGVFDRYGSWFYRKNIFKRDYINSGVLLMNLQLIKETGLFEKCRKMCKEKELLLPDQHALNKLAKNKLILKSKYNEQKCIKSDTVFRHFSTTFKLFPFKTQSIKPWHIDKLHEVLNTYELDDILDKYLELKGKVV